MTGPVGHILAGQHGDTGDRHGAGLEAGGQGDLPFRQARQLHDDPVARPKPRFDQHIGQAVGSPFDVREGQPSGGACVVAPQEGKLAGIVGPAVDDIAAEIEGRRNVMREARRKLRRNRKI